MKTVNKRSNSDITICTSGCGCCACCIMVTFLIIFSIEFTIAITYKEAAEDIHDDSDDSYSNPNSYAHLANFLSIMYIVEIIITLLFIILFMVKKLYVIWYHGKQHYHCFLIMALFSLWFIAVIIVSAAYEGENDTDLSFGRVLALIIVFTMCAPFCCIFCW